MEEQLKQIGMPKKLYLEALRKSGKKHDYNNIVLSNDGTHKIIVIDEDGNIHKAGRVGYGDYHIYRWLEQNDRIEKGTASTKRNTFIKSHSEISGNWKRDKYSPNNLAIRILWDG